jgi:hypothetical protein
MEESDVILPYIVVSWSRFGVLKSTAVAGAIATLPGAFF